MQPQPNPPVGAADGGKYLVFALEPNRYAVPIRCVREIIAMHDITPLPRVPHFVNGVINLRGRIIPVADLRTCLGMPPKDATQVSCIVVTEIETDEDGGTTHVGCIVDSVRDVLEIGADDVQEPPRGAESGHVRGLVRTDEAVVALLELEVLLGELGARAGMAA